MCLTPASLVVLAGIRVPLASYRRNVKALTLLHKITRPVVVVASVPGT